MYPVLFNPELQTHELKFNPYFNGILQNNGLIDQNTPSSNDSSENVPDFSDACLKYLTYILEEDFDESPTTLQEFKALQATEKSLYDVLGEEYSPSDDLTSTLDQTVEGYTNGDSSFGSNWVHKQTPVEPFLRLNDLYESVSELNAVSSRSKNGDCSDGVLNQTPIEPFLSLNDLTESVSELNAVSSGLKNGDCSDGVQNQTPVEPFLSLNDFSEPVSEFTAVSSGSNGSEDCADGVASSPASVVSSVPSEKGEKVVSARGTRRRKNHRRDGGDDGGRGNKQQAYSNEDYVEMKEYDDIILCREDKDVVATCGVEASVNAQGNGSKGKTTRVKKQNNVADGVDLRGLLTNCAQAVSTFDLRGANERLREIRQHCSPYGDSIQRVAYYFANALEARLAGTGSTISGNIVDARISSSDFLKAYRRHVSTIPCKRLSYFLANMTIGQLAEKATRIHIIDFGILLGLQWPCLIHILSKRTGGPPTLRITGIDYPQQGFRPAERVEATGRRLAGYCERFNVPFEYQAIAQKWESITLEDLKLKSNELVIVNCMYRSGTLLDETVEVDSKKDAFLRLIKQINPSLFIHGVVNGTYNAPFFITRFKEALFLYASMFDIFDETSPREDHERMIIESEMYGKELLNVIACEGIERIQRPETYKQWQVRSARAGLKPFLIDRELLGRSKAMLKANYHKDFLVDEDRHWMLQGWRGRTHYALSLWQPC